MPTKKAGQKGRASNGRNRTLEVRQTSPFYSSYANSAQVQVTYFDFRISFGEMSEITPTKLVVTNNMQVVMTPEHAKLLVGILSRNVENYEKQFGAIRESQDL